MDKNKYFILKLKIIISPRLLAPLLSLPLLYYASAALGGEKPTIFILWRFLNLVIFIGQHLCIVTK